MPSGILPVPAGVCPRCGAKVVRSEVGKRIAEVLGSPKKWSKASESVKKSFTNSRQTRVGVRSFFHERTIDVVCNAA